VVSDIHTHTHTHTLFCTGFLAAALAEILGAGSVLNQFAAGPQLVVITIGLITAGTVIPIVKGTDGGYLRSLLDTYA
jgi:hypothetical protein